MEDVDWRHRKHVVFLRLLTAKGLETESASPLSPLLLRCRVSNSLTGNELNCMCSVAFVRRALAVISPPLPAERRVQPDGEESGCSAGWGGIRARPEGFEAKLSSVSGAPGGRGRLERHCFS